MYNNLHTLVEVLHRSFSCKPLLTDHLKHLPKYTGTDWIQYLRNPNLRSTSWTKDECNNKTIIERNQIFQLSLIRWDPMQCIPFHDHRMNDSTFMVLKGQINESRLPYSPPHDISQFMVKKGEISYITANCQTLHQLENKTPGESVSLHLNSFISSQIK